MKLKGMRWCIIVLSLLLLTNCNDDVNNSTQSIPVLTTDALSNITSNSCETGGKITSNGNSEITSKGIVWSKNPTPTLTDFFTQDGDENTNFTSSITNLQQNTTYYLRAYAINNIGIAYGQEESFTTLQAFEPSCLPSNLQKGLLAFFPFTKGSINDFSGNKYHLTNTSSASAGIDRGGNINCAFNFVQKSGDFLKYVNPTFINDFQTLPFSISLWYKPLQTNWGFEVLIGRDIGLHCPDTSGQWSISLYDCRRPVLGINQYSLWDDYFNGNGCDKTTEDLSNVWQHLIVTCIGTDLKLYKNGVLTTEKPGTGCGTNIPTINAGDLFLGKDYTGLLDDVIIYNRILTQTEITELYNLQSCSQ